MYIYIYIHMYIYIYIIYLGKLQRPNPVLPNPGIVVNFREIIPFYGPTIQVSEIFWPLPRSMGMGFTSLVWLPESRRGWKNKAGTKSGNKNSIGLFIGQNYTVLLVNAVMQGYGSKPWWPAVHISRELVVLVVIDGYFPVKMWFWQLVIWTRTKTPIQTLMFP